jgi:hypothetical protein
VGIGSISPGAKLEINNSAGASTVGIKSSSGNTSWLWLAGNGNSYLSTSFDLYQDNSNNAGINNRAAGGILLSANGSERMRIDSSGNVGIGTSSPGAKLDVSGNIRFSAGNPVLQFNNGGPQIYVTTGNTLQFSINSGSSEAMRIDSSGRFLYATTTSPYNSAQFGSGYGTSYWSFGPQSGTGSFLVQNGSNFAGVYLPAQATSWSGTSDENLKNITGTIQEGLKKLTTLRAAEFTWKSDDTNKPQVGLIAQDLQKVLPEVIDTDSNGNLSVRYSEVIPLLVAAIQELDAKFEAYKATHP